jgi:hypothetical protein
MRRLQTQIPFGKDKQEKQQRPFTNRGIALETNNE